MTVSEGTPGRFFIGGCFVGLAADPHLPWWWVVTFAVAGLIVAFVGCLDMWRLNRRPQVIHHRLEDLYTVHRCPPTGSGLMPCCGRTPFEVPLTDKMTEDARLVTCKDRLQ